MNLVKRLFTLFVVLVTLVITPAAFASESYQDKTPTWSGVLSSTGTARGHATIECDHPTRGTNVRMHAGGLVANTPYTLYLVDFDGKEKTLGVGGGKARSDGRGWLDYSAKLAQCPLGSTLTVLVRAEAGNQQVMRGTLVQQ